MKARTPRTRRAPQPVKVTQRDGTTNVVNASAFRSKAWTDWKQSAQQRRDSTKGQRT